MVDSIHVRKPSTAAAETSTLAAKLRVKMRRRPVRKDAKLALIGAKLLPGASEGVRLMAQF